MIPTKVANVFCRILFIFREKGADTKRLEDHYYFQLCRFLNISFGWCFFQTFLGQSRWLVGSVLTWQSFLQVQCISRVLSPSQPWLIQQSNWSNHPFFGMDVLQCSSGCKMRGEVFWGLEIWTFDKKCVQLCEELLHFQLNRNQPVVFLFLKSKDELEMQFDWVGLGWDKMLLDAHSQLKHLSFESDASLWDQWTLCW